MMPIHEHVPASTTASRARAVIRCAVIVVVGCAAPGAEDGLAADSGHGGADTGSVAVVVAPGDAHAATTAGHAVALSASSSDDGRAQALQSQDTLPRDSVAELPRATVDPRVPQPTGRTIKVGPRANLQSALNRAQPGDVVSLTAGATYSGNFTLPRRPCGQGWITVRTDTPDDSLPGDGERMTPAFAGRLAKISTPNQAPALKTVNPTCRWRVFAVEVTGTLPMTSVQYGLVWLGDGGYRDGGENQTSADRIPADLVLDRVYIHGSPTLSSTRCLSLNSARTAVVNSWLSECHASGFDSQAIVGWNGPGPYLIENNHLEGAGENVMFGGADPAVHGVVPSDITIRRNHFYKPLSWKGGPWSVKNLFELKSGARVLVESNVFENNWPAGQEGAAIVIKSNANGCQCAYLGTRDLTFRYNVVRNAPVGLALSAADNSYGWTGFVHTQRVRVEHNLFANIGAEGSRRSLMLFTQDLADIELAHNTFVHATGAEGLVLPMASSGGGARRLVLRDNVFTATAGYAFHNSDNGSIHTNALKAFVGDGSWVFARNVVGGMLPEYVPQNPPASWYPRTVAAIGLAPDYSLGSRSQYKGRGRGGADPGANIPELTRRTAGVVMP